MLFNRLDTRVRGAGRSARVVDGVTCPSHRLRRGRVNESMILRLQAVGLVIGSALALTAGTIKAEDVMFRVDYVRSRTRGATLQEHEEGTHTFALTGHRRVDRAVDGRRITEITIPVIAAADGVLFVIDHSLSVVRRAPLNLGTGNQASTLRSEGAPMRCLGEETQRSADPAPLAVGAERHDRGPLGLSIPEPGRRGR